MKAKQLEAIQLLVSGLSQSEVAHKLGVSDRTLRNWLKQEDFQSELSRQVKERIEKELLKRVFVQEQHEERKKKIALLIDEAITQLDFSKPHAVEVLIKWYKVLDDASNKQREALLELYKKTSEEKREESQAIKIVIENAKNGQNDNP